VALARIVRAVEVGAAATPCRDRQEGTLREIERRAEVHAGGTSKARASTLAPAAGTRAERRRRRAVAPAAESRTRGRRRGPSRRPGALERRGRTSRRGHREAGTSRAPPAVARRARCPAVFELAPGEPMRIAAIELFVEVKASRAAEPRSDADAVARAIRARASERREEALELIRRAAGLGAALVLCPGWTFVGRAPTPRALSAAAGAATVVFEVLDEGEPAARKKAASSAAVARRFPWSSHVHEGGSTRELAPQVVAVAEELDDEERARALAEALRSGRSIGDATLFVCGEINVMRRRTEDGKVGHVWEPGLAAAGMPESAVAGRLVLNPAHTPNGTYVRHKWRAGPWRAIVNTANTLDRAKLGRTALPAPASAIIGGEEVEGQVTAAEGSRSRIVAFDV
jgi:hypothetical protein